jgi:hypothetical protein
MTTNSYFLRDTPFMREDNIHKLTVLIVSKRIAYDFSTICLTDVF